MPNTRCPLATIAILPESFQTQHNASKAQKRYTFHSFALRPKRVLSYVRQLCITGTGRKSTQWCTPASALLRERPERSKSQQPIAGVPVKIDVKAGALTFERSIFVRVIF